MYDPITGRWKDAEAMSMLRSRVGVAVMKNKLFAIGGYNGSDRLGMISHKKSLITIFGHKHEIKNFIK